MYYLKTSIGIFLALAASRFIPHPPNFTSLLALSFYVPALLGVRFVPSLIIGFIVTDLIIGFHNVTLFTWGSVIFIGLISKFFVRNIKMRIFGTLLGALIFYIVTNFGVWSLGTYGYSLQGLITSYILAIPFFWGTLSSTIIYAIIIEFAYKIYLKSYKKIRVS